MKNDIFSTLPDAAISSAASYDYLVAEKTAVAADAYLIESLPGTEASHSAAAQNRIRAYAKQAALVKSNR